MSLEIRDFEQMVEATLNRIVNANIGITNTSAGSVVRTLVEALLSELDIQNYTSTQIYKSLGVDDAVGDDLDRLVSILGIARKQATRATGVVTFTMTEPSVSDVVIQYAQMLSTKRDINGNIIEFMTTQEVTIPAGGLSVDAPVQAMIPGYLYIPIGSLNIMNTPVIGVDTVRNNGEISSGTNDEDDNTLRAMAKGALSNLGKGTNNALKNALLGIQGVIDAMVIDMSRGVGTSDAVIVTDVIPPTTQLDNEIKYVIANTKAAGIDVQPIYPDIYYVDVDVTTTHGAADDIGNAILGYANSLKISEPFIINQMERSILNKCDINNMDVSTVTPASNVTISGTQIIRCETITINGVLWNG